MHFPYRLCVCLLAAIATSNAEAAIIPYTADANTRDLWHFDDAAGNATAADAGLNNYTLAVNGGASIGASSLAGFGNAVSTSGGTGEISQYASNVATSSLVGSGGAFSLDMLVKLNAIDQGGDRFLFTLESNGNSSTRVLHVWYYLDSGNPTIEVENIGVTSPPPVSDTSLPLPTSGANAVNTTDRFHLGIAFQGAAAGSNNLSVYWTKADPANTVASLLGTGTWGGNLKNTSSTNIGVGNDARGTAGFNSINGSIDEVRISDIARGADQFIFTVPEPSAMMLSVFASLAAIAASTKKRR